jgi:hypothetical protein
VVKQDRIKTKATIIVALLCWISVGWGAWVSWGPGPEDGADVVLMSVDRAQTTFEIQLHGIETRVIDADGTECTGVNIPGAPKIMEVGFPEVPMIRQALVIPDRGDVVVDVVELETRDVPCDLVVPSKGHINRSVDPATIPFTFGGIYQQDTWFPEQVISYDDPFIVRDLRGTVVQVNAVRFNPVQKMLRVVTKVVLEVRTSGDDGLNIIDRAQPSAYVDWDFHRIYHRMFLNYDELDYVPIPEPGRMFIITHPSFETAVEDFFHWKLQKGVPTELYTLNETGYSASQIQTFIQNAYNSTEGLTYIVLVGDVDQVPTLSGLYEGADSDPSYVKLAGNDNYPDAFISRISATNSAVVEYQAYKFIRYEMTPDTGPAGDWYHMGTGIGGDDTGGTGIADWERCELLRQVLLNYNYTVIDQIYHSSATAAQVTAALNDGRSIVNYIGHGSTTSWGTTGFSNSNVYALSNGWMQPFIIDVACDNGYFSYGECFAEAWLRAGSMSDAKGAVGIYAASTGASWVPPCDMQTHMVDLLCEEERNTLGGLCFNGVMYAMDIWGAGNYEEGNKLMEQYNLFGDCNLMMRTDTPAQMVVNHDPVLFIGLNTFDVQVAGLEGALASLYYDGVLYGSEYTDATGAAVITMASPPSSPMTLTLTVTAYNRDTYITDIQVIPMSGPYLTLDSMVVDDVTNPNGIVEYGETVRLSVWLENLGISDAMDVVATLVSGDRYVTLVDDTEPYGTIGQGAVVGRINAFEFDVRGDVPDGHFFDLTLLVTGSESRLEWEIPLTIEAHSADFQITGFVIDDFTGNGNGVLEAGETADITLTLDNNGTARTTDLIAVLSSDSPYLQIVASTSSHGGINPGNSGTFTPDFQVSVLSSCPAFTPAVFYIEVTGSRDLESHLLNPVTLGGFMETVESGQGAWTHTYNTPGFGDQWHISTQRSYSPTHSWKCGDTGTGQYSNNLDAVLVTPTLTLPENCQLTFCHWMDAEASGYYPDSAYDGGIVEVSVGGGPWTQIDPEEGYTHHIRYSAGGGNPYTGPFPVGIPCFSGQISWSQVTFDLTGYSGSVQIRFRFGSDNAAQREGWFVDDIQIDVGSSMTAPSNLEASLMGSLVTLTWSSPGVSPELSLLGYNVYRNSVRIDSLVQAIEYTDDLSQHEYGIYSYQVSAEYEAGESPLSSPAVVNYTGGLPTVENLEIQVVGDDIQMYWLPVEGATGYRVYFADSPDDPMHSGTVVGTPSGVSFVHVGANANNARGFYVVTAVDDTDDR